MSEPTETPETTATPVETATTTEAGTPSSSTTASTPVETPPTPAESVLDTGVDKSWLPEEYRDNPNLNKFGNQDELYKSHLNLVAKIGEKGAIKPGADATPEQWNEFYTQLGRPAEASGYELSDMSEEVSGFFGFDENTTGKFKDALFEMGASPEQAQAFWEKAGGILSGSVESINAGSQATQEATMTSLQEKWGTETTANVAKAQSALEQLGLSDMAAKYNLANDAGFVERLATISNILKPDNGSGAALHTGSPVQVKPSTLNDAISARHAAEKANDPVARIAAIKQIRELTGRG